MNNREIFCIILLLLGTFIASVSQVLLKFSAKKKYKNIIEEYLNPLVVIAYFFFAATMVMSVFAYREVPLSLGPVLESTGYVYITLLGFLFFKERINWKKWVALALIIGGVIVSSILG